MTEDDRWQTAIVTGIRDLTPRIKSFTLELPRPVPFVAGQHADVRLTAEDGYVAMRSYSIASEPGDTKHIELAIERLEDGEVSPFFHDVVRLGDEIEVRTPLGGHFVWRSSDGGPLLLVGAGSGIVPLVSMVRHGHAMAPDLPVLLLASARTWQELPFRHELLALHRRHEGFVLRPALTRDETSFEDVDVFHHRIDAEAMHASIGRLSALPRHVFVCGSSRFVDVASDALIDGGLPAASIRTERYGS